MSKRIIVALDCDCADSALALADALPFDQCRLKVGKELFTRAGPGLVDALQRRGFEVFLDLKFHDIPNTVAGAVRAAADLGVWMVNVHASGGRRMMEAAREALAGRTAPPLLIGVTVLTSLSVSDLTELGETRSPRSLVSTLAALAAQSGLDGVVCSALEASMLRRERGGDFCLVTPGIRMSGEDSSDQRRIVTPARAVGSGADYLVVGRSITAAADPAAALQRVLGELTR